MLQNLSLPFSQNWGQDILLLKYNQALSVCHTDFLLCQRAPSYIITVIECVRLC